MPIPAPASSLINIGEFYASFKRLIFADQELDAIVCDLRYVPRYFRLPYC